MSKEETKQHFAELCECIWNKLQRQDHLDDRTASEMRKTVANCAMIAWNTSLIHTSYDGLKKTLTSFAETKYDSNPCALIPLMDAAELKWHDYRDDKDLIAGTEVKMVRGKPKAIAYLKEEIPHAEAIANVFHDFMNSTAIQERLRHMPPEKLEEEIGKIVAEYNASLPDSAETGDEMEERDFPISDEELETAYRFMRQDAPQEYKKEILVPLLKHLPFLGRLCKSSSAADSVSDIIMAVASVYLPDTDLIGQSLNLHKQGLAIAKDFVSAFTKDEDFFYEMIEDCAEPNLFAFLAESVSKLNLSSKEFKQTLSNLIAWGFMIEAARAAKNPDKYPEMDDDEPKEEHYDFGRQKTLRLFYLHVKLRGCRVSVDLTVPEDTTFADLHTVLNSIFERDDDHLYRFECDDGCTAVRDEEELEDVGAVLADKCYLGHHLKNGSKVYYLFDYGDEWEHDITVKKVVDAEPKDCHFEVLKITGEIPEQYSDEEEQ